MADMITRTSVNVQKVMYRLDPSAVRCAIFNYLADDHAGATRADSTLEFESDGAAVVTTFHEIGQH